MHPLSTPTLYSLELTPACNNRCPVCSNVFTRQPAALAAADWGRILDQIAPDVEVVKITGGEPTLHPEFNSIVRQLAEKDIPFALFTNGRWRDLEAIITLLKNTPQCTGLLISLHGPDVESHEGFTHTPRSFEEACANIRRATAAGLPVHTSTVITRHNWTRLGEVVALAQTLGARRAVFNRYLGPPLPTIEIEPWQLREAVRTIERLMAKHNNGSESPITVRYGNCIPQCFTPSSSTGCWAGVAYCTIDPWGNLRPCNHSPTIAGNVLTDSIETIWQGEQMNAWRALTPDGCLSCTAFETCRGGCRAMLEIEGSATDPLMRVPLQQQIPPPPRHIDLYEKGFPTLQCTLRTESFGYALVRGHTILPIMPAAQPLLAALDGQHSLQKIERDFGQEGLDFVGTLYLQGLVSIE